MQPLRSGILRPVSLAILGLVMAACSSGGSAPPASIGSQPSSALSAAASVAATVAGAATPSAPVTASVAPGGGTGECAAGMLGGHVKYTLSGFEAWHFCGPATGSVTLGGSTITVTSGWCETNAAGYSVAIGTQLFGSPDPSQEPDVLIILVAPTTGVGTISGVVAHKHWAILGGTVAFTSGQHGGTWSGSSVSGAAVHGSYTC